MYKSSTIGLSILLLVFFSKMAFTQNFDNYEKKFSDTLPQKFILDKDKLREHIFLGIPYNIRTGEYSRRALNFSHTNACEISDYISSGIVYSNWDELESYINAILQKVMPPELQKDSMIHVYIVRDGRYNAFMVASGHAFVHTGLLAEVSDEATIAGILCHELSHYYLRHSLNYFLEEEAGNFDQGLVTTGILRKNFEVGQETQADSLGAVWLQNSGYSIEGMISAYKTIGRLERNYLKKDQQGWKVKERTHPSSAKRLEKMQFFYNQNKEHLGKKFLIDENKFYKFKQEIKPEILKSLLDNFDYSDCFEKSFKYHLFDPDNSTYVYYIMEGIRRYCYLNVNHWKEMFITKYVL